MRHYSYWLRTRPPKPHFFLNYLNQTGFRAQPAQPASGSFLGIKQPERKAINAVIFGAEVKNVYNNFPLLLYALMTLRLSIGAISPLLLLEPV
jgi:hypothetical protein